MKDVPTFAELGYPELTARVWFGLLVKQGTPSDIVARLTDAAKAAHADPAVRSKLEAQGYEVTGETGPQLMPDIKAQFFHPDGTPIKAGEVWRNKALAPCGPVLLRSHTKKRGSGRRSTRFGPIRAISAVGFTRPRTY